MAAENNGEHRRMFRTKFYITSMGNLASMYRNQGRWNEAKLLEVQAMELSKKLYI